MKHVGPSRRQEAAGNAIEHHDAKADKRAAQIRPAQEGLEGRTGCVDLGRDIDQHKNDERDGGKNTQRAATAAKATHQKVSHSKGSIAVGEPLKALAHQEPSDEDTKHLAKHNPISAKAYHCSHAGNAQEEPGRLARSLRGKRRDPKAE